MNKHVLTITAHVHDTASDKAVADTLARIINDARPAELAHLEVVHNSVNPIRHTFDLGAIFTAHGARYLVTNLHGRFNLINTNVGKALYDESSFDVHTLLHHILHRNPNAVLVSPGQTNSASPTWPHNASIED